MIFSCAEAALEPGGQQRRRGERKNELLPGHLLPPVLIACPRPSAAPRRQVQAMLSKCRIARNRTRASIAVDIARELSMEADEQRDDVTRCCGRSGEGARRPGSDRHRRRHVLGAGHRVRCARPQARRGRPADADARSSRPAANTTPKRFSRPSLTALCRSRRGARRPAGGRHRGRELRRELRADRRQRAVARALDRLARPPHRAAGALRSRTTVGRERIFEIIGHSGRADLHAGEAPLDARALAGRIRRGAARADDGGLDRLPAVGRSRHRSDARLAHALLRHPAASLVGGAAGACRLSSQTFPRRSPPPGRRSDRCSAEVLAETGLAGATDRGGRRARPHHRRARRRG